MQEVYRRPGIGGNRIRAQEPERTERDSAVARGRVEICLQPPSCSGGHDERNEPQKSQPKEPSAVRGHVERKMPSSTDPRISGLCTVVSALVVAWSSRPLPVLDNAITAIRRGEHSNEIRQVISAGRHAMTFIVIAEMTKAERRRLAFYTDFP